MTNCLVMSVYRLRSSLDVLSVLLKLTKTVLCDICVQALLMDSRFYDVGRLC